MILNKGKHFAFRFEASLKMKVIGLQSVQQVTTTRIDTKKIYIFLL